MVRTKDFVLVIILCILVALAVGFFLPTAQVPIKTSPETTIFIPARMQDVYVVYTPEAVTDGKHRDAFIQKLREKYGDTIPEKRIEPEPVLEIPSFEYPLTSYDAIPTSTPVGVNEQPSTAQSTTSMSN